jgi:hypothetical protein
MKRSDILFFYVRRLDDAAGGRAVAQREIVAPGAS